MSHQWPAVCHPHGEASTEILDRTIHSLGRGSSTTKRTYEAQIEAEEADDIEEE
jgi:hypothetical protein